MERGATIRKQALLVPLAIALSLVVSCVKQDANATPDFDSLLHPDQSHRQEEIIPIKKSKHVELERPTLQKVLDDGFGQFLSTIKVEPHFENQIFDGWEIVLTPYRTFDLQAGDIVKSINGASIERPAQAFSVWKSLETTNTIALDIEREGLPLNLLILIKDNPT